MPDGYEIPVHRALTQPILMAGVPRKVVILNMTLTAAMVMGLGSIWVLPLTLAVHLGFVSACRNDPEFFDILLVHLRQKEALEA